MQDLVRAGDNCAHRRLARGSHFRDRVHRQRIGVEQAAEPQLAPQQAVQDRPAERGWSRGGRVERRQLYMCRHHRLGTLLDSAPERHQLQLIQARPFERHAG